MSICATTGKSQYKDEKEADIGLSKMKERMPSYEGEVYYCLYCGSYHFGRSKEKSKTLKKN